MWSEWMFSGLPELGDYIQVVAENEAVVEVFEGFVTAIDNGLVSIAGVVDDHNWTLNRWRRWNGPGHEVKKLVEEMA